MKIVCVSDLHGQKPPHVGDGDVLIFAGDWSDDSEWNRSLFNFISWLSSIKKNFKHIIVIPGNCDLLAIHNIRGVRDCFKRAGIHFLIGESVVIDGIKIYGFPWLNQYDIAKVRRNAYVVSSFDMDYRLANIPADTRILVTHGPPHKVLDMVQKTSIDRPVYIGGGMLGKAVGQLKPAIHVFGHAHSGHGVKLNNGTISVNAALCNTRNEVAHMPVVVNFDPEHPEQSTVGFVYQPLAKKKA